MALDNLQTILDDKLPLGCMVVRTKHESPNIELFGSNRRGFAIPMNELDKFIDELRAACKNPEVLYKIGAEDRYMEIPSAKMPEVIEKLKESRDEGARLGTYTKIF